jgi:hypothetical protein
VIAARPSSGRSVAALTSEALVGTDEAADELLLAARNLGCDQEPLGRPFCSIWRQAWHLRAGYHDLSFYRRDGEGIGEDFWFFRHWASMKQPGRSASVDVKGAVRCCTHASILLVRLVKSRNESTKVHHRSSTASRWLEDACTPAGNMKSRAMTRSAENEYHGARARQHRRQAVAATGATARDAHIAMAEHHAGLASAPASADVSNALHGLTAGQNSTS